MVSVLEADPEHALAHFNVAEALAAQEPTTEQETLRGSLEAKVRELRAAPADLGDGKLAAER